MSRSLLSRGDSARQETPVRVFRQLLRALPAFNALICS